MSNNKILPGDRVQVIRPETVKHLKAGGQTTEGIVAQVKPGHLVGTHIRPYFVHFNDSSGEWAYARDEIKKLPPMAACTVTFVGFNDVYDIEKAEHGSGVYLNAAFFPGFVSIERFIEFCMPIWGALDKVIDKVTPVVL